MQNFFTKGFYKNLIGFATILLIGISITAVADTVHDKEQTAQAPVSQSQ